MRLLDRYLLRELFVPLGYCLGGFLVFWVSFDLLSELDEFQRRSLLVADVVDYYLVRAPELFVTVTPIGLLLALLYALTNHARHHELTAMLASGVSLWRVCVPYLATALLLCAAIFALNEYFVPDSNEAAARVLNRHAPVIPGALDAQWQRNLTFHNEAERRIWNIGAFHRPTGAMLAPNVEWSMPDGSKRRISAQHGLYTNDCWLFLEAKELLYPPEANGLPARSESSELMLPELSETPEQIRSEIKYSELSNFRAAKRPRLSLREILNYKRLHPRLKAEDQAKLETQFHGRLAEPWTCLVVVLIAIPFGAPSGRRNVFVGVASSIFIGFAYFILLRFGLALGTGGYVPPWVAAWLPNMTFSLVGLALIQRVR
jgi:lipopolysaccharide export system permease protein